MLLHFKTKLATAIETHNLQNGNYIGITQELKVIPLVYDTTDEEFYVATDFDFDTPVDMTGIEVAYMDNQNAIYQQAEIEELIATSAEEPEEDSEVAPLAMAEQEPIANEGFDGGSAVDSADPETMHDEVAEAEADREHLG